jgi:hypothetical protein
MNIAGLGKSVIAGYYAAFNGSNDIGTGIQFGTQTNAAGGTVERMRIDSSGNVGIGTTSPASLFAVDNGTITTQRYGSTGAVILRSASGTQASPTVISSSTGIGQFVARGYDGSAYQNVGVITFISDGAISSLSSPGYIQFATTPSGSVSSTERMRITSAGNVGIGATSPTEKLTVVGNVRGEIVYGNRANAAAVTAGGLGVGIDGNVQAQIVSPSASAMAMYTGGTERMRIDSSGNVGIGTTSPRFKLSVGETATTSTATPDTIDLGGTYSSTAGANPKLRVFWNGTGAYGLGVSNNQLDYMVPVSAAHVWYVDGTERMRITSAGNVGIGTSSPAGAGRFLNIQGSTSSSLVAGSTSNANFVSLYSGQTVDANPSVLFNNSLRFGTATSPDTTGYTERMRIHASGGVSIGNTTDSGAASLNVSGSMSGGYIAHANGTTAMAFGTDNVARVTPTATASYTTTVPAAGAICVLSILTSGATSYTITFSTGFKSTGTLATGTTTARYFNITFVSDGTNLIEMSRTVAIA